MGILLGLVAALCWGTGDYMVRDAARQVGTFRTLLYVQFIGFVALGVYLAGSGELLHLARTVPHSTWAWAFLAAFLDLVATVALYKALATGVVSIVSPIVASYAAITAALSIFSGAVVTTRQGIGMAFTLAGVGLTAGLLRRDPAVPARLGGSPPPTAVSRGIVLALLAAAAYGVTFWVIGFHVTPVLGTAAPVWIIRLVVMSSLLLCAAPLGQSIKIPTRRLLALVSLMGVLDTGGLVAVAAGAHGSQTAIVGVLSSLFSAVTIVLAWIFIHERLAASQWAGIIAILSGVVLIGM